MPADHHAAPPPTDPDALRAHYRQTRRARLYDAAGVQPSDLPAEAVSVVEWLVGWDDSTVEGVAALLDAARRRHGNVEGGS